MAKSLPWFRLYAEAIDDEKLRLLAFEDRWHFVALLCCKCQGIFDNGDSHDRVRRKLAVKLGVQLRELDEIHRRLSEEGLVGEDMAPANWDSRQFKSDADNTTAERQRRYRQRHKRVSNALHNGDVTRPDTDTDTELRQSSSLRSEDSSPAVPDDVPDAPSANGKSPPCPAEQIVSEYQRVLPELPQVAKLTDKRRTWLQARWREDPRHQQLEFWTEFFQHVRRSPFLMGETKSSFRADFEWLINKSNFYKTIEERYHHDAA